MQVIFLCDVSFTLAWLQIDKVIWHLRFLSGKEPEKVLIVTIYCFLTLLLLYKKINWKSWHEFRAY